MSDHWFLLIASPDCPSYRVGGECLSTGKACSKKDCPFRVHGASLWVGEDDIPIMGKMGWSK